MTNPNPNSIPTDDTSEGTAIENDLTYLS